MAMMLRRDSTVSGELRNVGGACAAGIPQAVLEEAEASGVVGGRWRQETCRHFRGTQIANPRRIKILLQHSVNGLCRLLYYFQYPVRAEGTPQRRLLPCLRLGLGQLVRREGPGGVRGLVCLQTRAGFLGPAEGQLPRSLYKSLCCCLRPRAHCLSPREWVLRRTLGLTAVLATLSRTETYFWLRLP